MTRKHTHLTSGSRNYDHINLQADIKSFIVATPSPFGFLEKVSETDYSLIPQTQTQTQTEIDPNIVNKLTQEPHCKTIKFIDNVKAQTKWIFSSISRFHPCDQSSILPTYRKDYIPLPRIL